MKANPSTFVRCLLLGAIITVCGPVRGQSATDYQIFVSNEKAGTLTVFNASDLKVTATIPVGKRPRGIHASPDGKTLYVALSGTPISAPPKLDAQGNPIFQKGGDDDDDDAAKSDKAADGIAVVDVAQKKMLRRIPAGSDPENFAVSTDGSKLFISNEDAGAATMLDLATGKIHLSIVTQEPEGVGVTPDGKAFYVTCETAGDVFVFDSKTGKEMGRIKVHPRPRSVDFLPDGTRAFIPSESAGEMNLVDSINNKLIRTVALAKGDRPMCVKVAPDAKKVYVSTGRAGTVCVLDPVTLEILDHIKVGQRPWGIAISPDGQRLYAANGPSDDVSVVDLATAKEIARVKSPGSPWGVVIVPATP